MQIVSLLFSKKFLNLDFFSKIPEKIITNTFSGLLSKTLLIFFDALGNENEYTKIYRKKFSSIMFS